MICLNELLKYADRDIRLDTPNDEAVSILLTAGTLRDLVARDRVHYVVSTETETSALFDTEPEARKWIGEHPIPYCYEVTEFVNGRPTRSAWVGPRCDLSIPLFPLEASCA